ncbi:MAG: polysaccharide deacetylase family protein [Ignavibacteriales bacterium]
MRKRLLLVVGICLLVTVGAGRLSAAPTVISRGATGQAVRDIQKALNSIGIPSGPADGVFGPSTEKAVRLFQARKKLPVDGVVGPRTRAALDSEMKALEKRLAEQRRLEQKRVFLEELKKKTLNARRSPAVSPPEKGRNGTVYLTLDDGPDPGVTPRILDILKSRGVRATFFVIGERAEQYRDLVRRMISEGHGVQNHSYAHEQRVPASLEEIEDDIARGARALEAVGGTRPHYYRPPYGDTSPAVFQAARNQGHTIALWSNIWGSGAGAVLSSAFDGSIIMLKEQPEALESLPEIIDGLTSMGYHFGVIGPAGAVSPSD